MHIFEPKLCTLWSGVGGDVKKDINIDESALEE